MFLRVTFVKFWKKKEERKFKKIIEEVITLNSNKKTHT